MVHSLATNAADGTLIGSDRLSFEKFIEWYPEDGRCYELYRGIVIEKMTTGTHEDVGGFLAATLNLAISQGNLPFSIPRSCLLKPKMEDTGFIPDVAILDRRELVNEPLWQKSSVIQNGKAVPLVIEVVSTNWRNDYAVKLAEYEAMGIAEYWIVDYLAVGAVRHIGKPKQPTITICKLIDEEFQLFLYRQGDRLESDIFPQLNLSADAIFDLKYLGG